MPKAGVRLEGRPPSTLAVCRQRFAAKSKGTPIEALSPSSTSHDCDCVEFRLCPLN